MGMEIHRQGGIAIVCPAGRLMGGPETEEFSGAVLQLMDEGNKCLVIDLSAVEFMNSVAIGQLIMFHGGYQRRGGQMKLCGLRDRVASIFASLKFSSLVFQVHPGREEAVASFEGRGCGG